MRDDLSHRSRLGRPRQGAGPREMCHRRPRHVPVEPLRARKLSVGAVCTVSKTRGFALKLQDYWDPSACMTRSSSAIPRSSARTSSAPPADMLRKWSVGNNNQNVARTCVCPTILPLALGLRHSFSPVYAPTAVSNVL
jgi:hypothetical protein